MSFSMSVPTKLHAHIARYKTLKTDKEKKEDEKEEKDEKEENKFNKNPGGFGISTKYPTSMVPKGALSDCL